MNPGTTHPLHAWGPPNRMFGRSWPFGTLLSMEGCCIDSDSFGNKPKYAQIRSSGGIRGDRSIHSCTTESDMVAGPYMNHLLP